MTQPPDPATKPSLDDATLDQPALDQSALNRLFLQARTYNAFSGEVSDALLHRLYDLVKFGPTTANTCPARFVFVRSAEAKAKLGPALDAGNHVAVGVTVAAALLMVSRIRYNSFKGARGPQGDRVPFFAIVVIVAVLIALVIDPPKVLLGAASLYALSGPATWLRRRRIPPAIQE